MRSHFDFFLYVLKLEIETMRRKVPKTVHIVEGKEKVTKPYGISSHFLLLENHTRRKNSHISPYNQPIYYKSFSSCGDLTGEHF